MPAGQERGGRARAGRGAPSLRAPSPGPITGHPAPATDRLLLRLALSKGLLGLELDAPFALGPLRIVELALSLPGVRFPVDLTGGVARFRHRRGELTKVVVEAATSDLIAWAAPRLRGILGESTPDLVLAPTEAGVLIGVRRGAAALAFDVLVAPIDGALRLLPERARGVGLGVPPHVLAMRILGALARPFGRAVGGAIVIADAAAQIGRHLLPSAGGRAPSAVGVRWEAPSSSIGRFSIAAHAAAPPAELSERALRALEVADLASDADIAALEGDLDRARSLYLGALERAPRHPELSKRLAWIDATAGERPEGALSTIVDAFPAVDAGVLGGMLLAAVGDHDGARMAYTRGAQAEPFGPLAALAWLEAARLAVEIDTRLEALDEAVTRAPALETARWARLEARLEVADVRGAKGDADQLEAAARGPEARHTVWRRAAEAFLARGFVADAGPLFERALRYMPDNAEAVAGLARALNAAGQGRRALDLFARAIALAARAGRAAPSIEIELARALADVAGDRPAAVARVRAVAPGLPESFEARFLEGRWRAELGDLAGAGLAFGRLRDAVEVAPTIDPERAAAVAAMLVEAARIEEDERGDLHAAQRDLGLALRLRPRDRSIGSAFRRVAAEVAHSPAAAPTPPPTPTPLTRASPSQAPDSPRGGIDVDFGDDAAVSSSRAADEVRVVELTDRVRANPDDHASAMELADALGRLGRDLDLLALLSARMEEGDEDVQFEVAPRRREVLLRLAAAAREAGRASEAELYEMMATAE